MFLIQKDLEPGAGLGRLPRSPGTLSDPWVGSQGRRQREGQKTAHYILGDWWAPVSDARRLITGLLRAWAQKEEAL